MSFLHLSLVYFGLTALSGATTVHAFITSPSELAMVFAFVLFGFPTIAFAALGITFLFLSSER